jgi:hypothetical protein
MATFYVKTSGNAANSGCTDSDSPLLTGTAVTGLGTTTLALDGSPDLSGLITAAGPTQSTIFVNNATNTNRKIFKITDKGADTVTVDVAPTGADGGTWRIGGRHVYTAAAIQGALFAGDIMELGDSPAAVAADWITCVNAGDSTSGFIKVIGKTGVRPVINVTNTTQCIEGGTQALWWFENLELDQDGASGAVVQNLGTGCVVKNVKIIDGGGHGISTSSAGLLVIDCEITGLAAGDGINIATTAGLISGCYIHDLSGDGIECSPANPQLKIVNNIIDTVTGRGIAITGNSTNTSHGVLIMNNTVYGCGDTGLEITDADTMVQLINNIFSENGNAAGEFNAEWVAGAAERVGYHSHNVFFHSGGGGGANLSGLTVNGTEATTDPALTNPASADFSISAASPAAGTGTPGAFLGGPTGYRDMGAVQRQVVASAGGAKMVG